GRSTTVPGTGAFEESTPADAQTNPCFVSAITSGGRVRTTRFDSRRITSRRRGSSLPARRRASSVGSTSASRTTRPSAFETAFCASADKPAGKLERELLGARIVAADERVLVGQLLRCKVGGRERLQARCHRPADDLVQLLGKRALRRAGQDAVVRERKLARDT